MHQNIDMVSKIMYFAQKTGIELRFEDKMHIVKSVHLNFSS